MTTEVHTLPAPEMEITTLEEPLIPYEDNDDPLHRTHLVREQENTHISNGTNMSSQDIVDTARMLNLEVVAICGYKWVPKHNPDKYEACKPCLRVAEAIMRQEGW